ncbi:hypothetical protein FQR65_LT20428 [Abscondita terminalis]|nr:hypothetical protein FQR65_LT20428 [Abscondita terminalis]
MPNPPGPRRSRKPASPAAAKPGTGQGPGREKARVSKCRPPWPQQAVAATAGRGRGGPCQGRPRPTSRPRSQFPRGPAGVCRSAGFQDRPRWRGAGRHAVGRVPAGKAGKGVPGQAQPVRGASRGWKARPVPPGPAAGPAARAQAPPAGRCIGPRPRAPCSGIPDAGQPPWATPMGRRCKPSPGCI